MKRPKNPELPLVCARHWDRDKFEVFDPAEGVIMVDPRSLDRRGYLAPMILRGNNVRMRVEDKSFVEIEGRDPTAKARAEGKRTSLARKINYETLRRYLFICRGTDPDDPKLIAFLENHDMRRPQKAPTNEELIQMYHEVYESMCDKVENEMTEAVQRRFTESFPNAPQVDTAKIRKLWAIGRPFCWKDVVLYRLLAHRVVRTSGEALAKLVDEMLLWETRVDTWAQAHQADADFVSALIKAIRTYPTKLDFANRPAMETVLRGLRGRYSQTGTSERNRPWPVYLKWNSSDQTCDFVLKDGTPLLKGAGLFEETWQELVSSYRNFQLNLPLLTYRGQAQTFGQLEVLVDAIKSLQEGGHLPYAVPEWNSLGSLGPLWLPTKQQGNLIDFQTVLDEAADQDSVKAKG